MSRAFLEALEPKERDEALADPDLDEALMFVERVAGGMTPSQARETFRDEVPAGAPQGSIWGPWVRWRRTAWFTELMQLAQELWADVLEREAQRRAKDGFDEPVFYQGAEVGQVRRYDSQLLQMLLKGLRPERYRERSEVVSAPIHIHLTPTDEKL